MRAHRRHRRGVGGGVYPQTCTYTRRSHLLPEALCRPRVLFESQRNRLHLAGLKELTSIESIKTPESAAGRLGVLGSQARTEVVPASTPSSWPVEALAVLHEPSSTAWSNQDCAGQHLLGHAPARRHRALQLEEKPLRTGAPLSDAGTRDARRPQPACFSQLARQQQGAASRHLAVLIRKSLPTFCDARPSQNLAKQPVPASAIIAATACID